MPRQLNPRISEAHEEIILTAMEQDPEERFQSVEAMRKAILAERGGTNIFCSLYKRVSASSFFDHKHLSCDGRFHNRDERGILFGKEHL